MIPSSWLTLTKVRSSASVILVFEFFELTPIIFNTIPARKSIMIMTGVRIYISAFIIGAYISASRSECTVAAVLGEISPKISTSIVNKPVVTPVKLLPKIFIVSAVASAEAEIFTMLLPIRIALNILPEFSFILATVTALLLPSSIKERILILFTVVNAVSAEEKKADKANRITIHISWMILSVSKKNQLLYYK